MTSQTKPLTMADLEERWGISHDTIMKHIAEDGLRFFTLGRTTPGKRAKLTYRFRLADVEQWEADRVRVREKKEGTASAEPPGRPIGYTGKIHTKTGRATPRAKP